MSSGAALLIALPTHDGQQTAIALRQMTGVYLRRGPQVMDVSILLSRTPCPSIEIISVRWTVHGHLEYSRCYTLDVHGLCNASVNPAGSVKADSQLNMTRLFSRAENASYVDVVEILLEIRYDR